MNKTETKKKPLKTPKDLKVGEVSKDKLWEVVSVDEAFVVLKPTAENKNALGFPTLEKSEAKDLMEK